MILRTREAADMRLAEVTLPGFYAMKLTWEEGKYTLKRFRNQEDKRMSWNVAVCIAERNAFIALTDDS